MFAQQLALNLFFDKWSSWNCVFNNSSSFVIITYAINWIRLSFTFAEANVLYSREFVTYCSGLSWMSLYDTFLGGLFLCQCDIFHFVSSHLHINSKKLRYIILFLMYIIKIKIYIKIVTYHFRLFLCLLIHNITCVFSSFFKLLPFIDLFHILPFSLTFINIILSLLILKKNKHLH